MRNLPPGVQPATANYGHPWIDAHPDKLVALNQSLMDAGVRYELGAKVVPLSLQAQDGIRFIDCSGESRWAIAHATGMACLMPDGSVEQREWCESTVGLKPTTPEDCLLDDGAVRIAFLTPEGAAAAGLGAGNRHVMLVTGGLTIESHGSHGPDRRSVASLPWFAECVVYVLRPPQGML